MRVIWTLTSEPRRPSETAFYATSYDAMNHTVRMLNESMGLCLPTMRLGPRP